MDVYSCSPYDVLENLCIMRIKYETQNLALALEDSLYEAVNELYNKDENKNILEDYLRIKPELTENLSKGR